MAAMGDNKLAEILQRVPLGLVLGLYVAYVGYDYYNFMNDPASPLLQKKAQLAQTQALNQQMKAKIKKAEDFYHQLDQQKAEIRAMVGELGQIKATLSDEIDVAAFIKTLVTEAGKVGLTVQSIKPTEPKAADYYVEQPFDLSFKGVYAQLFVFLDRLSKLDRIVRVDRFDVHEEGPNNVAFVTLDGTIQIKTYRYLASKADDFEKDQPPSVSGAKIVPASAKGGGK